MILVGQKFSEDTSVCLEFDIPVTEIYVFSEREVSNSLLQKVVFSVDWQNIKQTIHFKHEEL